jgi:hypothetical protein
VLALPAASMIGGAAFLHWLTGSTTVGMSGGRSTTGGLAYALHRVGWLKG